MAPSITPADAKKFVGSTALKGAEWMAENAYIAPGFHRLLTAGGLTLGLWGGRHFMDVLTARNAANGEEIPARQAMEIVRPLHGILRYNPYSDKAADRWKFVIDRVAPVALGAVGAYYGGKIYMHGHMPGKVKTAFFPAGEAVLKAVSEGRYSTEITEAALRVHQSDGIRKLAAITFTEGSASGQQLFGALWPFNNGQVANAFMRGAGRNASLPFLGPFNEWFGNHGASSRYLYGALRDTATWMKANILHCEEINDWAHPDWLMRRAKDGLQLLRTTPAEQKKLADAYEEIIKDGYAAVAKFKEANPGAKITEIEHHLGEFISGMTNPKGGFTHGNAHDRLLHGLDFDLSKVRLASDPLSVLARLCGSRKEEFDILVNHAKYLKKEFGYDLDPVEWANAQLHVEPWKVSAIYAGGATAVAAGLGTAAIVADKLHSKSKRTHKPRMLDDSNREAHLGTTDIAPKPKTDGNIIDWINDKPLNVAHWIGRVLITPPSMHRFMNAAYLSAVLYGGVKVSNILTGRVLTKLTSNKFLTNAEGALLRDTAGELISESRLLKEDVWAPLRPLHDLLKYTPGSAKPADRWKQAAHYIMPVSVGMFGTYAGSHMYFADRIKSLSKPVTLEDYTDKISLEQSKFYAGATALTSIFNTGSGIHLLPVFNYSANLHNRYLLGSGQQVAMPGLGKWWSGNPGTTPWGVKRTLNQLTNYLTYNDGPHPRELSGLVHSLIGKLYPDLDESELLDKKQIMLDRIHDVRDSYLVEGVVPPSKQAALGTAMRTLFSGAGFEALLQESGLDPAKADLANNGASGKIANFFGSKKDVRKLEEDYRSKFARRTAASELQKPAEFLKTLIDHGPVTPKLIAEAEAKSFTDRVKSEPAAYPVMG